MMGGQVTSSQHGQIIKQATLALQPFKVSGYLPPVFLMRYPHVGAKAHPETLITIRADVQGV